MSLIHSKVLKENPAATRGVFKLSILTCNTSTSVKPQPSDFHLGPSVLLSGHVSKSSKSHAISSDIPDACRSMLHFHFPSSCRFCSPSISHTHQINPSATGSVSSSVWFSFFLSSYISRHAKAHCKICASSSTG
jgi:hypothetical protein